jgi:hypothetical protein
MFDFQLIYLIDVYLGSVCSFLGFCFWFWISYVTNPNPVYVMFIEQLLKPKERTHCYICGPDG